MSSSLRRTIAIALVATVYCQPGLAQAPVPPPAPTTLWNFLGIPQGVRKVQGALINRRGNFPGLERKPPLRSIADPRNLLPEMPEAVKEAAKIKQAEDLKKQKIKAVKYLAKIGCGCYDLDNSVTDALIASTKDCTEEVRLATVEAISSAAQGECCANCGETCCCKEDMVKRLAEMAYEKDDHGCWVEPSARVRAAAVEALRHCCPNSGPIIMAVEEIPPVDVTPLNGQGQSGRGEGPTGDDDVQQPQTGEGPTGDEVGPPAIPTPGDEIPEVSDPDVDLPEIPSADGQTDSVQYQQPGTTRTAPVVRYVAPPAAVMQAQQRVPVQPAPIRSAVAKPVVTVRPVTTARQPQTIDGLSDRSHQNRGALMKIDAAHRVGHVHFADRVKEVPVGTELFVYRPHAGQLQAIGKVRVTRTVAGSANVEMITMAGGLSLEVGDAVGEPITNVAWKPYR